MEKKALRQHLLTARKNLSAPVWLQKSQLICTNLLNWQIFQRSQVVLSYVSFRQEPDLQYLWQQAPSKIWGFPRCVGNKLVWHQVNIAKFSATMVKGAFGILEPLPSLPLIDVTAVDLIFTPTLACDCQGFRLGYGAGYYDRFFADVNDCDRRGHSYRVGVLFAETFGVAIPKDPWDIPMQAVCTETGIHIMA
jgi:5-formyltetrahydrofolate cyclo-ligase